MTVRIGSQTPTRSVILPYNNSLYKEAVARYEESDRKVQPWQAGLLKHIFARNDDNLWTHTK